MEVEKVRTLKEVSKILGISLYKVNQIRPRIIADNGYAPEYMIHGTLGNKITWNIKAFKRFINLAERK